MPTVRTYGDIFLSWDSLLYDNMSLFQVDTKLILHCFLSSHFPVPLVFFILQVFLLYWYTYPLVFFILLVFLLSWYIYPLVFFILLVFFLFWYNMCKWFYISMKSKGSINYRKHVVLIFASKACFTQCSSFRLYSFPCKWYNFIQNVYIIYSLFINTLEIPEALRISSHCF